MKSSRCPKKGEIVWCALDPIRGHEQAGSRPCVVISGTIFNQKTGMIVVCPITSTSKTEFFFRIEVDVKKVKGFIMADQIRTLDWKERVRRSAGFISQVNLKDIHDKLAVLFDQT